MPNIIYNQKRLSRESYADISYSIVEIYINNIARDICYFSWNISVLRRLIKKFGSNNRTDGLATLELMLFNNERQLVAARAELARRMAENAIDCPKNQMKYDDLCCDT